MKTEDRKKLSPSGEQDSEQANESVVTVDGNKFVAERLGIRMTLEFPGITRISEGSQETLVSLLWNHFNEMCVHLGNSGLADASPYPEAFAEDKVRTW